MADVIDPSDRAAIVAIVEKMEAAWNAGDGTAFGEPFTADADFITIRTEHLRGREAIAQGHVAIFRTSYSGSTNKYTVESIRLLRPDVAVVHVHALLNSPSGPLLGKHSSLFTLVLTREAEGWKAAAFHNTLSPPGAG